VSEHRITIRDIESLDELQACVRFQEAIWGESFSERVPLAILKVSRRLGGVVAGAFDASGEMMGFVFGMTGPVAGELVHWSDMLAVRKDVRNQGIGRALKAYQRERCLEAGVKRMRWTFDPLEARNAYLNLGRLGALVPEYVENMYGDSDSHLHRGLGTDRFVALWELDSPRVAARLADQERLPAWIDVSGLPHAFPVDQRGPLPRPGFPDLGSVGTGSFLVPVPDDIQFVKREDAALARAWRSATREALVTALAEGGRVEELVLGAERVSFYVVVRPGEEDEVR
jgi:predicted GNAT superfamily acetyltransferase